MSPLQHLWLKLRPCTKKVGTLPTLRSNSMSTPPPMFIHLTGEPGTMVAAPKRSQRQSWFGRDWPPPVGHPFWESVPPGMPHAPKPSRPAPRYVTFYQDEVLELNYVHLWPFRFHTLRVSLKTAVNQLMSPSPWPVPKSPWHGSNDFLQKRRGADQPATWWNAKFHYLGPESEMGYHDIDFAPVEYFLPNTWAWVGYENWLPDGKRSLAPKLHCLVWYRKTVREDVEFEIETIESNYS